jgi:hypothetical protein
MLKNNTKKNLSALIETFQEKVEEVLRNKMKVALMYVD